MEKTLKNLPPEDLPLDGEVILYPSTDANVEAGITFQHATIENIGGVITAVDHQGVAELEGDIVELTEKHYLMNNDDGSWSEIVIPTKFSTFNTDQFKAST